MNLDAKADLIAQIETHLTTELAALTESLQAAHAAATHPEAKAENKYDTRGLEASYLAGAQQERVAELQLMLQRVKSLQLRSFSDDAPVAATALVELDQDGTQTLCFLLPVGAGYPLLLQGRPVVTVTTQAPLARALLGRSTGDVVTVATGSGPKDYEILAVY